MSSPIKEEFHRFKKLWINYGKVIVGGMMLSSIFLFLYAGIRANYVFIAVLTAVVSTVSLSVVILLLYARFHEKRLNTQPHKRFMRPSLAERFRSDDEELRRLIVETIAGSPSTQTKASHKPTLLVSVFQWGHLIGKVFYYGMTMVKLELRFRQRS